MCLETEEVEEDISVSIYPAPGRGDRPGRHSTGFICPYEYGYEFKVTVTNKWASGKKILIYHNGLRATGGRF